MPRQRYGGDGPAFTDIYDQLDYAEGRGRWRQQRVNVTHRREVSQENNNFAQENDANEPEHSYAVESTSAQYNAFDFSEIKAMIHFFTDSLAKFPTKAPEILRKVMKDIKTDEQIVEIINVALFPQKLAPEILIELCSDLQEINSYARKTKKELSLTSKLNYDKIAISKMVYDAAIESILEKQTTLELIPPVKAEKPIENEIEKKKEKLTTEKKTRIFLFECFPALRLFHKKKGKNPKIIENEVRVALKK